MSNLKSNTSLSFAWNFKVKTLFMMFPFCITSPHPHSRLSRCCSLPEWYCFYLLWVVCLFDIAKVSSSMPLIFFTVLLFISKDEFLNTSWAPIKRGNKENGRSFDIFWSLISKSYCCEDIWTFLLKSERFFLIFSYSEFKSALTVCIGCTSYVIIVLRIQSHVKNWISYRVFFCFGNSDTF